MEKRLVTRYRMGSTEAADENQRRIEGVFEELAATTPDNVSYTSSFGSRMTRSCMCRSMTTARTR